MAYDPRRGILHHDREDSDAFAFVFDTMEPGRPLIDAAVLKFLGKAELKGADFVVRSDGVCRVAPQLAKVIAMLAQSTEISSFQDQSGRLRMSRTNLGACSFSQERSAPVARR